MAEDVDRVWVCRNDGLEFDLEDENIKIISGPRFHTCVIEVDGRIHSLVKRSWGVVKRIRTLEEHGRSTSPVNVYEESISKENRNE